MSAESLGSQQRANADRQLSKILLAGLCGSAMFHTAALAGVSYLSQNSIDDLEITAIERVEVDPDPVPTPSIQPTPTPAPKIVKPIIAAVPIPVTVKIPTPKAISTPPPVVKIVKSKVAIPPPTSPVAKVVAPAPNRVTKAATPVKVASKPNSPPAFPDRLFTDPTLKIEQPQPQPAAPPRTRKTPAHNTRIASNRKATNPDPNINQTGLGINNSAKNPGSGVNFGEIGVSNHPSGDNDSIGGTPGNNTLITRNNGGGNGVNGTGVNQTGLGGGNRRNRSIGDNLDGNGSDKLGSEVPGKIVTGSKKKLSIKCLRNCEIRYPDHLKTSDIGKDKIWVKVSIDRNGSITSAEIVSSSGNAKLDQAALAGVNQMQFTAIGEPSTSRIKVNTLSR